jgi:sarcosine oxidase
VPKDSDEALGHVVDPLRRSLLKVIAGGLTLGSSAQRAFAAGEPSRVEVAVVGAGLFGGAAATHLAANGARSVVIIGPREIPGDASPAQLLASHYDESRNATSMDTDPEWAGLARSSVEPLLALEKRSRTKILHELGSLRVAQGGMAEAYFDLDGIRETAAKLGNGLVDLAPKMLASRYPDVRFDPNSRGLLQERNAGLIRPRRLVAALRKVAVEDGAMWMDDEVTRIDPKEDHVDLLLGSGTHVHANRILVCTGAAPLGHALLSGESNTSVELGAHRPTHIQVPDDFETTLPPTMIATSGGGEFFGGFVAPPLLYPDGRRYLKVVGQSRSLLDGSQVSDQESGAVHAAQRLFPSLKPAAVHSRVCMTTDTASGRPIIDWVDARIAVAIAGNGKGAKAALEIGRRAAALVATPRRA